VLDAIRIEVLVAAVAYMLHAAILETFASPTEGMMRALALGVQAEKELYISQVAHDIGEYTLIYNTTTAIYIYIYI
jgi:hypothetical protein